MIPFYWVTNYYRLHNRLETSVQDQIKFFQRIGSYLTMLDLAKDMDSYVLETKRNNKQLWHQ